MAVVLLPLLVVGLAATLLIAPLYGLWRPTPPAPTRILARPGRRLCSSPTCSQHTRGDQPILNRAS